MPSFTAKHYQAIADLVHKQRLEVTQTSQANFGDADAKAVRLEQINATTLAMAKLFEQDNPKFKQMTFIAACNRDLIE